MKELRDELALTQQELAHLLGVSRSVIALSEKGLRNLPTSASMKLAELQLTFLQPVKQNSAASRQMIKRTKLQQAKAQKFFKKETLRLAARAMRASRELEKMQERHNLLIQKMNMIQLLKRKASPATPEMSLLEIMEDDTLDQMDECCPSLQAIAQYKMQTLQARQLAVAPIQKRMTTCNAMK